MGSLFFAVGILLVLNLHNMLVTRVCPLNGVRPQVRLGRRRHCLAGNGIGALLAAAALQVTRFKDTIWRRWQGSARRKLGDGPASLFVLGIFCGFFVAFAVLVGAKFERGSLPRSSMYGWLSQLLSLCGFEHIVADMFYLSCYAMGAGADALAVVKVLVSVSAGNLAGGLFIAWAVRRLDHK